MLGHVLLISFVFFSLYLADADPQDISLTFPIRYKVTGVLYLPYAEIKEPFLAYFDARENRSRVDYYGDLVKTYQRADVGNYGTSYKVAFMPDEAGNPIRTCFQVNGTENTTIGIQSLIPDLTDFVFVRSEPCPNTPEKCEVWLKSQQEDQKSNKYTAWLTRTTAGNDPVLRQYEMRGYNSLLGSHYDKYMVRYDSFSDEDFRDDVFNVDPNITCRGFPGPGLEHVTLNNPIAEFIDNQVDHVKHAFEAFKVKHGKSYQELEHEIRKSRFLHNYRFIHSKNRASLSFRLSVNHLADKSDDELRVLRGRTHMKGYNGGKAFLAHEYNPDIPDNIDWRLFGAVTPVKDQAVCGSCWSFGTVGTIEGAHFVKTGQLLRLSEQQLIDCSWGDLNNGCDGGEDFRAYKYIMRAGGLATDEDYGPYLGVDGRCHEAKVNKSVTIESYVNVTSGNEKDLRFAIAYKGPISVSIDASRKTFSFYSNGVYYDPYCGNKEDQLDHSVLAVGYGTLNGEDYWLIKNSWSTYWGNDGYVLMSRKDNNCGVATSPTFVNLA